MERFAILVAGGSGSRMQISMPKQFLPLDGKPILQHTIEAFQKAKIENIIVVLPKDHIRQFQEIFASDNTDVTFVEGGNSRIISVMNGLASIQSKTGFVAIHDGVRPFIRSESILSLFSIAENFGNAVPFLPIKDSLRRVKDGENEYVDRNEYVKILTPQIFEINCIKKAYLAIEDMSLTDCASVAQSNGESIRLVEGEEENIKITTPMDLKLADLILQANKKGIQ